MTSNGDHDGLPPDLAARLAEEDAKADLEMERVLAMSDEEVMRELEAEGMTREQVEADAVAMAEKVPALAAKLIAEEQAAERAAARANASAPASPVRAITPKKRAPKPSPLEASHGKGLVELYASWGAVAAAAAAIVGAWGARAWSLAHHPPDVSVTDAGEELTHDQTVARRLRAEAFAACEAMQWTACKAKLDDARALDPAGEDTDPRVGELRARMSMSVKGAGETDAAGQEKSTPGGGGQDTDDKKGPGNKRPR